MRLGRRHGGLWLLAVPFVFFAVVLVAVPALIALGLAFSDFDGLSPVRFVGLQHFTRLWTDPLFWAALEGSLWMVALVVPARMAIALFLALLLGPPRRWVRPTRAAVYLPSIVPEIAYALLWLWLLNPLYGPISVGLRAVGVPGTDFLLSPWGARLSIAVMLLFQIGEVFLVLLAARKELPPELYELSAIEGASAAYTFREVTLPLMLPSIGFLAARDVVWTLQATFVPALIVTNGGPRYATTFLPLYIYQNGFEFLRFGYASAMTLVMLLFTAVMMGAQLLLVRAGES
jgi:multiple sugar transport system permease protein